MYPEINDDRLQAKGYLLFEEKVRFLNPGHTPDYRTAKRCPYFFSLVPRYVLD